jgi:flagellar basal-body rod protein FlgG
MIKAIFYAGRSLDSKFKNIEVIGNNLANVNSTGYKKSIPFNELVNQLGESKVKQATNYGQGSLVLTANPLDMSINGEAFFSIQTDNGIEFTRNGRFKFSEDGSLVNEKGLLVLGQNGPININSELLEKNQAFVVTKAGEIKVGDFMVDTLLITRLDSVNNFVRNDGTNFSASEGTTLAGENDYEVLQGYLEESNVNPIEEMTAMIKVHNEYDSVSKMVNFLDKSLEEANAIGKVY